MDSPISHDPVSVNWSSSQAASNHIITPSSKLATSIEEHFSAYIIATSPALHQMMECSVSGLVKCSFQLPDKSSCSPCQLRSDLSRILLRSSWLFRRSSVAIGDLSFQVLTNGCNLHLNNSTPLDSESWALISVWWPQRTKRRVSSSEVRIYLYESSVIVQAQVIVLMVPAHVCVQGATDDRDYTLKDLWALKKECHIKILSFFKSSNAF